VFWGWDVVGEEDTYLVRPAKTSRGGRVALGTMVERRNDCEQV